MNDAIATLPSFDAAAESAPFFARSRPPLVSQDAGPRTSRLALCLRRAAARGLRIVVISPRELGEAVQDRFPERRIKPDAHVYWETGRRVLLGRSSQPHDRTCWHVLAVDGDGRVVGTISARFFAHPAPLPEMQLLALANASGPILHEQCELALKESYEAASSAGRTFGEISNWAMSPGANQRLIGAMLIRGMAALVAAFDNPMCVLAANQFRHEVSRLMRRGAAPLGRIGKYCLPPLIDHRSASWLRMLLVDTATFHARSGTTPDTEAGLLRRRIATVSIT